MKKGKFIYDGDIKDAAEFYEKMVDDDIRRRRLIRLRREKAKLFAEDEGKSKKEQGKTAKKIKKDKEPLAIEQKKESSKESENLKKPKKAENLEKTEKTENPKKTEKDD